MSLSGSDTMLAHPDIVAKANATPANRAGSFEVLFVKQGLYTSIVKRGLDLVLVALSLPFVLPLIGICAVLILMTGNSPFYRQERVGKNGRRFGMWKLRTMSADADQQLKTYLAKNPEARREWQVYQKLRNDPRILPVGRIMRKLSIDELPQILNVVAGEMSIVGPRPMLPEQQPLYPGLAYYALRPGLTGYWQISDRHNGSFAERADHDASYAKEISLWTDVAVIASTVRVVMRGTGC